MRRTRPPPGWGAPFAARWVPGPGAQNRSGSRRASQCPGPSAAQHPRSIAVRRGSRSPGRCATAPRCWGS
eukprot:10377409-Lingulodinium_polyedra.AAC.1